MSRYDLRNETEIGKKPSAFGALDTKVTTALESLAYLQFQAIGSPEYETNRRWAFDEPPFEDVRHDGLPIVWEFPWLNFTTSGYDRCGGAKTKEECFEIPVCGWCTFTQECTLGHEQGPALGYYCENGWAVYKPLQSWAVPVIASVSAISALVIVAILGYNCYASRKGKAEGEAYSKL